jgi:TolB-like protein
MSRLKRLIVEIHQRSLWQALAIYLGASFAVLEAVDLFIDYFTLPRWLFPFAFALLVVGLPIVAVASLAGKEVYGDRVRPEDAGAAAAEDQRLRLLTWRSTGLAFLAALAMWGIVATGWLVLNQRGSTLVRERIAVVPFEDKTGDPAHEQLGNMAAEWIATGLAHTGLVEVVPSMVVRQSSEAARVQASALAGMDRVRALAEETGAGTLVWGTYYKEGETILFRAEITDVTRRRLLVALEPVRVPINAPSEGVEVLRQRVMGALGTLMNPRLSGLAMESVEPPTYASYQEYSEGLALFFRRQHVEALPHFYRAAALDSTYLQPLLFAAINHYFIGQRLPSDSLTGVVSRYRERLLPEERHLLDYLRALARGDVAEGYRAARQAVETAPGPFWRFLFGTAALVYNRPLEALEVLDQIDPEGPAF